MATNADAQARTVTVTATMVRPSGAVPGRTRTAVWLVTVGQ
jgi:hypothetical protein